MIKKRTYIYRSFERFWHWSQALLIFFLAFTGFEIHGTYDFIGFENSVKWHDIAAWAFLVLIVFTIFWHFVTGEWKQYIPTTKFIKAQVSFYITGIFKGAPHPTHKTIYTKFNPLQRVIYLGLKLLVIPIQFITGFIYMFYIYPDNPVHDIGLEIVAKVHTLGAFALLAFVIAHVYLTTIGDTPLTSIKAMITGWEVLDVDEKEERKQHLQKSLDESVAGYYRMDREGKIIDVNVAWLEMYKYTDRDKIIGKHYSVTRDEENVKELGELFVNVLKGESVTGIPAIRKCMDGSTGKHVLSANPVIEDGEIAGMEGFILDITEREEFSEHMNYVIRNSSAGYYRMDENGIIVDVNDAWLKICKYGDKSEVIGKHCSIICRPIELDDLETRFKRVLKGETISGVISTRKCKDGSVGKHILSANPVYIGNLIAGMEGFILDITKLEKDL